jgi:hypothetical protein
MPLAAFKKAREAQRWLCIDRDTMTLGSTLAIAFLVCGASVGSWLWWAADHAPMFPNDEDM